MSPDSSLEIETYVEGRKIKSIYDTSLFKHVKDDDSQLPKADTIYKKDTLIVKRDFTYGNKVVYTVNQYFLKSLKVKWERIRYEGDSIAFYEATVWQFDPRQRLIYYGEYQGPPLKLYVSEKTIYDNQGNRILYRDYSPADGQPDLIWHYNEKSQIIKCTNIKRISRDRHDFKFLYSEQGLLTEERYHFNGSFKSKKIYRYQFLPKT